MESGSVYDSFMAYAAAIYKHKHQNNLEFHQQQITSYYSVKTIKTFSLVS